MNLGHVFPPFREGDYYGATRYMPLPVAMHAAIAHLTGGYLVAGKILGASIGALLLAVTFGVVSQAGLPRIHAVGLAACIAVTDVAITSFTGLAADTVPLLLQLMALILIANRRNEIHVGIAGLFCALAVLAKVAAVWGGLTIVVWLLVHERKRLRTFLPTWLGGAALGLLAINLVSGGSLIDTMEPLLFSGTQLDPQHLFIGLLRTFYNLDGHALPLLILLPLALAFRPRDERSSIYWIGLVVALLVLVAMMTEPSSAENHLLDVIVLSVVSLGIAMGHRFTREGTDESRSEYRTAFSVVLVFALGFGWLMGPRLTVLNSIESVERGAPAGELDRVPLKEEVSSADWVLAENPYVPFARGQRPVVLDPFLFQRMSRVRPEWAQDLSARVRAREFTKLVMSHDLSDTFWYTNYHFGSEVLDAIRDSYRLAQVTDGYFIYEPKAGNG